MLITDLLYGAIDALEASSKKATDQLRTLVAKLESPPASSPPPTPPDAPSTSAEPDAAALTEPPAPETQNVSPGDPPITF